MKPIFLLLVSLAVFPLRAQQTDKVLQLGLQELATSFKGDVGVYVYHTERNIEAAINADTIFPTASIVKIPILIGIFDKINNGELSLNEPLVYDAKRAYGGAGLMQFYKDSTQTDLRTLVSLMITMSDNTTSLWCQELAGGGETLNALMAKIGLQHTRVNSRTDGRSADWEKYGWGQTTPREMASLLIKIRNRNLISEASSDEMYRLLSNSFYTDYALSQIPPFIQTAAKQGMVNQSRSELVMVNAPTGDYVFYIATKNNEDTSWGFNNEAWQLQREISAYLWKYFNPTSNWRPAANFSELLGNLRY